MKYITASETCVAQLRDYFPENEALIDELIAPPHEAPIDSLPGETIPYVRINQGASRPVFYSPGFGEGVVNKLSFATALAASDFEVIMPGQNRSGVMTAEAKENMAVATQARNNMAVLAHAGTGQVDFVGHSFGGLVVPTTIAGLRESGVDTNDSSVALLASAGVAPETSYFSLAKRWVRMMRSEWGPDNKAFPDTTGETGKASLRTLLARPMQSVSEMKSLRHDRINFAELCSSVGKVAVFCYADDEMYPERHMEAGLPAAIKAGAVALSPVAFEEGSDGLRRMPGAVHDDEQFNPWRVVNPLQTFLRPK